MAIAAALNILVTSPSDEFKADLKKHGLTVTQFTRHMTTAFNLAASKGAADIKKMMSAVEVALSEGLIDAKQYEKGMRSLNGAFKYVEAGGDSFNAMIKESNALNEKYSSTLDKVSAKLAKLNAIKASGTLNPHVYDQAKDDITGVSAARSERDAWRTGNRASEQANTDQMASKVDAANKENASALEKYRQALLAVNAEKATGLMTDEAVWAKQRAAAEQMLTDNGTIARLEKAARDNDEKVKKGIDDRISKERDLGKERITNAAAGQALSDKYLTAEQAYKRELEEINKVATQSNVSVRAFDEARRDAAERRLEADGTLERLARKTAESDAQAELIKQRQAATQAHMNGLTDQAAALTAAHISPLQRLNQEKLRLNMLNATGALSQEAFNAEMQAANATYKSQTSVMSKMGFSMKGFKAAAGFLNPWLLGGVAVGHMVKVMGDFEYAMDRVQVLTGATTKEMKLLTSTASELGATTVFSSKDAALGMSALAKAGFKTNEIIAAMPSTLSLAAIGEMEVADASEIAARIMAGMKIPATELKDVIDAIAVASTNSMNTVEQLGEAMKFVGPAAQQAGKGVDEVMAVLMTLGEAGMAGELGGTAARNIFFRMANQTSKAREELIKLKVSFHDVNNEFLPMIDVLKQFEKAWKNMTGAERLESANKIFQTRSATGFNALVGAGSEKFGEYLNLQSQRSGLADKMAEAQNDNLWGDLERIMSAFDKFATDAEGLGVVLRLLAQTVTLIIQAFQTWYALVQTFVSLLQTGIAAIVGSVLKLVGMIPGFGWADKAGDWAMGIAEERGQATKDNFNRATSSAKETYDTGKRMYNTATGNGPQIEALKKESEAVDDKIAEVRDELGNAGMEAIIKRKEELQSEIDILKYGKEEAEARALLEMSSTDATTAKLQAEIATLKTMYAEKALLERIANLKKTADDAKLEAETFGMTEEEKVKHRGGTFEEAQAARSIDYWKSLGEAVKTAAQQTEDLKKNAEDAMREFQTLGMTEGQKKLAEISNPTQEQKNDAAALDYWNRQLTSGKALLTIEEERKRLALERVAVEAQSGKELDKWQQALVDAEARGDAPSQIAAIKAAGDAARSSQTAIDKAKADREDRKSALDNAKKAAETINTKVNPIEDFKKQFIELKTLLDTGMIDQDTFNKARQGLRNETLKSAGPQYLKNAGAVEAGSAEAYSATISKTANPEFEELKRQTKEAQKSNTLLNTVAKNTAKIKQAEAESKIAP